MIVDDKKFQELKASGVSYVCLMCEHFWSAYDKGYDKCMIGMQGLECFGVLSNGDFPYYKGSLEGSFDKYCFVCGKEAEMILEVKGKIIKHKYIGICKKHFEHFFSRRKINIIDIKTQLPLEVIESKYKRSE